jgi:prepilin-type N-terminal cleavage/methylation domain-containing protein
MRRGMTLFEMLMVLVIVVGLLAIGVPGLVIVNNGQRVNNAANSLAAALSQARARAIFDKRPHGIRLIATDPDNPESNKPSPPKWFDTIEFVYLPEPTQGYAEYQVPDPRYSDNLPRQVTLSQPEITGQGDLIFLGDKLPPYLITKPVINPASPPAPTGWVELSRPVDGTADLLDPSNPKTYTVRYRLQRMQAQSVAGLRPIQLPKPVITGLVDLKNPSANPPVFVAAVSIELLFAPDGSVFSIRGQPPDSYAIVFWIDRYAETNAGVQLQKRGPILVAVYPRTGKVATYPVNTEPDASGNVDPYYYVKNANAFTAQ